MTISNGKEVAVLETAEVRHGDPRILVLFMWIRRRLPSLGSEGELSDTICEHLSRVRRVVRVLLLLVDHLLRLGLSSVLILLLLLLRLVGSLALLGVTLLVGHHLGVLRL